MAEVAAVHPAAPDHERAVRRVRVGAHGSFPARLSRPTPHLRPPTAHPTPHFRRQQEPTRRGRHRNAPAGRDRDRGNHHPLVQADRRDRRSGRGALRGVDRQGRHRGSLARRPASSPRSGCPRATPSRSAPCWPSSVMVPRPRLPLRPPLPLSLLLPRLRLRPPLPRLRRPLLLLLPRLRPPLLRRPLLLPRLRPPLLRLPPRRPTPTMAPARCSHPWCAT